MIPKDIEIRFLLIFVIFILGIFMAIDLTVKWTVKVLEDNNIIYNSEEREARKDYRDV
jgi:hypothetical protein